MSKELIKELRAIEAYGETLISGYEARKYADAMEEMETENVTLREQLAEKEIELQTMRNAANQYKQWFTRVTAERDALRARQEQPNEPLTGPLKIGDSFHGMKIIGLDALAGTITFSGWEPFHRKPEQEE